MATNCLRLHLHPEIAVKIVDCMVLPVQISTNGNFAVYHKSVGNHVTKGNNRKYKGNQINPGCIEILMTFGVYLHPL